MKVLIVEDDPKTRSLLMEGLTVAGYEVTTTQNGTDGLASIHNESYDFIILDIMLPGIDGITLLKTIREKKINTPAIFLSAKHTVSERLLGLSAGSDDYMTKPFSLQELLLRMEIVLRRVSTNEQETSLTYRDLKMDLIAREVTRSGQRIKLQEREFLLLEYLLRNKEKILTKSVILNKVLEYQFDPQTNVVDVLVHRLRTKVDKDFAQKLIQTIRGVGYVLKAE